MRQIYVDGTNSIMKNLPRPCVTVHKKNSFVSIKMCITDYLEKGYLPLKHSTQENKGNHLVTDSKFHKGISRRAKYCCRGVSPNTLNIMTCVTLSDNF